MRAEPESGRERSLLWRYLYGYLAIEGSGDIGLLMLTRVTD
jgi:hypothetical protein